MRILQSKIFYFFLGLFLAAAIPTVYAAWHDPVSSGDPLTSTKWNNLISEIQQIKTGYSLSSSSSYTGDSSHNNNNDSPIFVTVRGGSNGMDNPCSLSADIDGTLVAEDRNNNTSYSKTCFISFVVPSGSSWGVSSDPQGDPGGGEYTIQLWE